MFFGSILAAIRSHVSPQWLLGITAFVETVSAELVANDTSDRASPFAAVDNLDLLYRVAAGEIPSSTIASDASTTDTQNTTTIQSDEPLFQQFLAWKRLVALRAQSTAHSQHGV